MSALGGALHPFERLVPDRLPVERPYRRLRFHVGAPVQKPCQPVHRVLVAGFGRPPVPRLGRVELAGCLQQLRQPDHPSLRTVFGERFECRPRERGLPRPVRGKADRPHAVAVAHCRLKGSVPHRAGHRTRRLLRVVEDEVVHGERVACDTAEQRLGSSPSAHDRRRRPCDSLVELVVIELGVAGQGCHQPFRLGNRERPADPRAVPVDNRSRQPVPVRPLLVSARVLEPLHQLGAGDAKRADRRSCLHRLQ